MINQKSNYKPKVICLEGADGCGKTTQAILLNKCFLKNNLPSIYSREPGGSILAEKIRKIILNKTFGIENDIFMYTICRLNHIYELIIPELQKGNFIILDRYLPSTIVYQGMNYKKRIEIILDLHSKLIENFFPDLTLILNITLNNSLERINLRKQKNFYDKKDPEFHNKIIKLYSEVDKDYTGEVRYIDANSNIFNLHNSIISAINEYFKYNLQPLTKDEVESYKKYNNESIFV